MRDVDGGSVTAPVPDLFGRLELEVTWWELVSRWADILAFLHEHPQTQLRAMVAVKPQAIAPETGWLTLPVFPPWVRRQVPAYEPDYQRALVGAPDGDLINELLMGLLDAAPRFQVVLPMGPYSEWWFPFTRDWADIVAYIGARAGWGLAAPPGDRARVLVFPGFPGGCMVGPTVGARREFCESLLGGLIDKGCTMVMAGAGNPAKRFTGPFPHPFDVQMTLNAPPPQRAAEIGQASYQQLPGLIKGVLEDCAAAEVPLVWFNRGHLPAETLKLLEEWPR